MSDDRPEFPDRMLADKHNGQGYLIDADHRASWNDFKEIHPEFTPGPNEYDALILHFYAVPVRSVWDLPKNAENILECYRELLRK